MSQFLGLSQQKFGFKEENSNIRQDYISDKDLNDRERTSFIREAKLDMQSQIQAATQKIDPRSLSPLHVYLSVSGLIESGECGSEDSLNVKFDIISGRDWTILEGKKSGTSQTGSPSLLLNNEIVWNFPFDCVFMATNPMGWPQIILTLYGPDFFGRNVVKGYGSVHFPTTPGYHERTVYLYKPRPMSWLSGVFGYLLGTTAEYHNPEKTIGTGEGREVTRVRSSGKVLIKFQVMERNMKLFGYAV